MTIEEFKKLAHFSPGEKDVFGRAIAARAEGIDLKLMLALDYMVGLAKRFYPDVRFIVHDINQGEHSRGSLHEQGKAVDGHFQGLKLPTQWYFAVLGGFRGIGAYGSGVWDNPGIHVDVRDQDNVTVWYAYKGNGNQLYEYDRRKVAEYLALA